MGKNPFGKIYRKLSKMEKRYSFKLKSIHNIPFGEGGKIVINIEWGDQDE